MPLQQGAPPAQAAATTASSSLSDKPPFAPKFRHKNETTSKMITTAAAAKDDEAATGRNCCNRCQSCRGFSSHEWRNTCTTCRCPRSCHNDGDDDVSSLAGGAVVRCCGFHRAGLGRSSSTSSPLPPSASSTTAAPPSSSSSTTNGGTTTKPVTCGRNAAAEAEGYAWMPPGLPAERAGEFMMQLPRHKRPILGSEGETYRQHQLAHQLPNQDLSFEHCQHVVGPEEKSSFRDFARARNDFALDVGRVVTTKTTGRASNDDDKTTRSCKKCQKELGRLAVVAPKFGLNTFWHPNCFTCSTCNELLVDLTYCVHDEALYCGRHYAENLKPRCGACDELILAGRYTKALGKDYHRHHFVCVSCNESLTGSRYGLTDQRPCCIPCYEQNFAHPCRRCGTKIGLDCKDVSYKDLHWHESCCTCKRCDASLLTADKPFASKGDNLMFCSSCFDVEFASRCDACGETFRPDGQMKKALEFKDKKWHDKCFRCVVCKQQVGSKPFVIPNDSDVHCVACYEHKVATKCTRCRKVMTTGGVTFKNEAWHRECFVCTNCQTMLAGQKFASREDKPYCAGCFGELFAKRCTACDKPITGAGGTRFISFEGRHWHSQCFVCASCKSSMAGKGFISDGEDIICPPCAKSKMMSSSSSLQHT